MFALNLLITWDGEESLYSPQIVKVIFISLLKQAKFKSHGRTQVLRELKLNHDGSKAIEVDTTVVMFLPLKRK